jgi:N utilization substance protein A
MRGTRVKNIVRELHGEKIDIIRWQPDIRQFIAEALSPAKIAEIRPDDGTKQALVMVEDDQLSLAIGKRGQNVRLAAKLTGWQLEIKSRAQLSAPEVELRAVAGVGPTMETRLKEAGIANARQLAGMTLEQLTAIKGIGEKTAERILEAAKNALEAHAAAGQQSAVLPEPGGETAAFPPEGEAVTEEAAVEEEPSVEPPTDANPSPSDEPPQDLPEQPEPPQEPSP